MRALVCNGPRDVGIQQMPAPRIEAPADVLLKITTGKIGAVALDDCKGSPVDQVLEPTDGEGADKGCECVTQVPVKPGKNH